MALNGFYKRQLSIFDRLKRVLKKKDFFVEFVFFNELFKVNLKKYI